MAQVKQLGAALAQQTDGDAQEVTSSSNASHCSFWHPFQWCWWLRINIFLIFEYHQNLQCSFCNNKFTQKQISISTAATGSRWQSIAVRCPWGLNFEYNPCFTIRCFTIRRLSRAGTQMGWWHIVLGCSGGWKAHLLLLAWTWSHPNPKQKLPLQYQCNHPTHSLLWSSSKKRAPTVTMGSEMELGWGHGG